MGKLKRVSQVGSKLSSAWSKQTHVCSDKKKKTELNERTVVLLIPLNQNYNKILESDWLSAGSIRALIGQFASFARATLSPCVHLHQKHTQLLY